MQSIICYGCDFYSWASIHSEQDARRRCQMKMCSEFTWLLNTCVWVIFCLHTSWPPPPLRNWRLLTG
jgi:hypothetical protein